MGNATSSEEVEEQNLQGPVRGRDCVYIHYGRCGHRCSFVLQTLAGEDPSASGEWRRMHGQQMYYIFLLQKRTC